MFICFGSSNSVNQAARSEGFRPFWSESLKNNVYVKDFVAYSIVDEGYDLVKTSNETSEMAGCWVQLSPCPFPTDSEFVFTHSAEPVKNA